MSFKEYITLNEKPTSSSSDIFNLIAASYIPLTPTMMDRLGYAEGEFHAFHATTMKHLKDLKKLGKSKKSISTFTKGLPSIINNIVVMPDVVAKLEGTALLQIKDDIYSRLDIQGRRWIKIHGKGGKFLTEAIASKVYHFIMEIDSDWKFSKDEIQELADDPKHQEVIIGSLSSSNRNKVYKFYFDTIEQLLQNMTYAKIVSDFINQEYINFKHNEIIMNKFKIKGVYSIEAGAFRFDKSLAQHQIEKFGLKYLGHINREDFSKVTPTIY